MSDCVCFWEIPGDLDIHTQGHCERVLLHALRIGEARHASDRQMTALAEASVFHDSRRKDNYLDTGHGARAANYYKDYCGKGGLEFLPEAYTAIWYHDRDDELGSRYIATHAGTEADSWLEVYRCFKDADALDRYRLGTWCLDKRFLRTDVAKTMTDFALMLVQRTIPEDEPAPYVFADRSIPSGGCGMMQPALSSDRDTRLNKKPCKKCLPLQPTT